MTALSLENKAGEGRKMYRFGLKAEVCALQRALRHVECVRCNKVPFRRIYRGKGGGISVFTTPQSADVFVSSLNDEERVLLRESLRIHDQEDEDNGR